MQARQNYHYAGKIILVMVIVVVIQFNMFRPHQLQESGSWQLKLLSQWATNKTTATTTSAQNVVNSYSNQIMTIRCRTTAGILSSCLRVYMFVCLHVQAISKYISSFLLTLYLVHWKELYKEDNVPHSALALCTVYCIRGTTSGHYIWKCERKLSNEHKSESVEPDTSTTAAFD